MGENSKKPHLGPPNIDSGSCLWSLPELCCRDAMPSPVSCWSYFYLADLTSWPDLGLASSLQTCLVITGLWMTLVPVTGPALLFLPRCGRTVPLISEATAPAYLAVPLALSSHFPAEQLHLAAPRPPTTCIAGFNFKNHRGRRAIKWKQSMWVLWVFISHKVSYSFKLAPI